MIYVGSLSKALGSTFRCSFVVAPVNVIRVLESVAPWWYPRAMR